MQRWMRVDTAAGQASLLVLVAGTLGVLAAGVPGSSQPMSSVVISALAILCGAVIGVLPWGRWRPRTTLVLALLAFARVVVGVS